MYHMIMLVLDDVNHCSTILEAWDAQGVGGITIFESTGMGRVRKLSIRDDIPLMPSLSRLLQTREERHRTLFTVVETEEMVDQIIHVTEEILGNMEDPHNGVIFVLPVSRVVGLHGGQMRAKGGSSS
ncbi:P-II family nitrogen regulator [Candidatus Leptofilum sp.]|uniref:P-II family nitrogen regulator n=1 Tax=Candidatus Leptofilum sp. TaxID=3241576 RepID=UPI003B5A71AF